MADKLEKFIADAKLSENLGRQARAKVENDYCEDKHISRILGILYDKNGGI